MKSIQNTREELPKVLLFFNLIFFIIGFFYTSKGLFFGLVLMNILFLFAYCIIKKYGNYFDILAKSNKMAKQLNEFAGR